MPHGTARIAQEALTNAARHGEGGAELALDFGEDELQLVVSNPARSGTATRPGGGHGISGMRERTIAVVGETADGRIAVDRARFLRPDVVLTDVRMPNLDGISATREVLAAAPETRVVILTTFEEDDYIFGALKAGASGFLLKRTPRTELVAAIHAAAAGEGLLSPSVTRRVIDRMAQKPLIGGRSRSAARPADLT